MKKGFVYSTDGLFAATIILILIASLYNYSLHGFDGALIASDWMTKPVLDAKEIGFYTHQGASAFVGVESAQVDGSKRASFCDFYMYYDGSVKKEHFCRGA